MALALRPYQQKAIDDLYNYFVNHTGNPLVVIPTGGGKSLIMAEWFKLVFDIDPQARILCITHVGELVNQNYEELKGIWPEAPAGIYSAGLKRKQINSRILFGTIQSLHKKAYKIQQCDMILIDECHLVPRKSNTMYRRFLDDLKAINPHLKIIGFTATHYRVDSGELHFGDDALFTDIAHETPVKELIDAGYLSRPISPKSASDGFQIDTTGIKTSMGDFMANQLEVPAMEPEAINAVVSKVIDAGQDRHGWLVFGVTVKHCRMLIDEFGARGISCDGIFGDTENRGDIIDDYKARKIRCLVSQGVLTTGFNARHVDLIALARPTKSTGLYVQMIGRGTRLSPETGKENCLILDFGGNIARHGPFDDPAPPKNKVKGKGNADPLVKYCPECEADNPIAASTCYCCGYEFPGPERKVFSAPSTASVMTEPPQWLNVDSISYAIHRKMGKPDSLKVTYMCGLTGHSEWICLEHTGYARAKAEAWWMRYASAPVPKNVAEALLRKGEIGAIGEIQVKKSGKYNEIVGRRIKQDDQSAEKGIALAA